MSTHIVNPIAALGFSVSGGGNDHYDTNRPSYPKASLQVIHDALVRSDTEKKLNLVELGSGTGIFTRLLIQPPTDYPHLPISSLTAIEPSKGMRESFARNLPKTSIDVHCVPGTFTEFPAEVEDGKADAVLIAQAFHWADPDYESPIKTITTSLTPTGSLILIWNLEDESVASASWVKSFRATYQQHEAGSPQYRLRLWTSLFTTPSYLASYHPPAHHLSHYTQPCTLQTAVERALSKSYTSVLPADEKASLKKQLEGILAKAVERGEIALNGEGKFEYPYSTEVVVCQRK